MKQRKTPTLTKCPIYDTDLMFSLLLIITIFWTILQSIEYIGVRLIFRAEQTDSKVDDQLIPFAIEIGKVLVIIFAIVIVLANVFDQNVTALAAGLGVGGVAVALASKESLENLLGSFTIFLDKPFQVGDVITIGSITGMVEKVGFRSTRVRTFDKSIVTVPNKNLVNVFVPTTPNPTSGFLLMFPKKDVIYLDMTFEEASKFIVSAGTSNPKH